MNAGIFDVLEHSTDDGCLAVTDAVDVEFNRVFQELVDQHRLARHDIEYLANHRLEIVFAVQNEHPSSPENERRPHQYGITEQTGTGDRFGLAERRPIGRLL